MSFYVAPPRGNVELEKIYEDSQIRIHFLIFISKLKQPSFKDSDTSQFLIENNYIIQKSDCLIDGTLRDRLSHFILRLCSHQNYSFYNFFLTNEVKLFRLRLRNQSLREKCSSLRSVKRQITQVLSRECDLCSDFGEILKEVNNVASSLLTYYSKNSPVSYKYYVPFYHVCKLVEHQRVPLLKGKAVLTIPDDAEDLLECLFENIVSKAVSLQRISSFAHNLEADDRLCRLLKEIVKNFHKMESSPKIAIGSECKLTLKNFDERVNFFPPCMQILNNSLNKHNRLTHKGRIQYTLFLKDCGLSLESSIKFWGQHYSKPLVHNCSNKKSSRCSHGWDRDGKRYVYGLRHLYGMEGSKTSYSCHSCNSLQNSTKRGAVEEGGCPFVHFDNNNLKIYLSEQCIDNDDIEDILSHSRERPSVACKMFLLAKVEDKISSLRNDKNDKSNLATTDKSFKKPTEYFATLLNLAQGPMGNERLTMQAPFLAK